MNFSDRLTTVIKKKQSCLLLGLDPNREKLPAIFQAMAAKRIQAGEHETGVWAELYFHFCREILEHTDPYICGIKIQMAYFEALGAAGIAAVEGLIQIAKERHLIIVTDGKRGDIGSTCEAYSAAFLADGKLGSDCTTVNPFLGEDGVKPFLDNCEKNDRGIFVLVKTSNPSANQFQEKISDDIARQVEKWGTSTRDKNGFSSIGAVVGATHKTELKHFRTLMPHSWILSPGIGAQGGSMADVLDIRINDLGVIIPVSRSVIYASNDDEFAEKAGDVMKDLWRQQK